MLAHLWRAVILPQALYGCEVRSLPAQSLQAVRAQGLQLVPHSVPLRLSCHRAAEIASGRPLGDCAVRDVAEEALARRLRWLLVLANQPGLVGTVHRYLATLSGPD